MRESIYWKLIASLTFACTSDKCDASPGKDDECRREFVAEKPDLSRRVISNLCQSLSSPIAKSSGLYSHEEKQFWSKPLRHFDLPSWQQQHRSDLNVHLPHCWCPDWQDRVSLVSLDAIIATKSGLAYLPSSQNGRRTLEQCLCINFNRLCHGVFSNFCFTLSLH